MLILALRSLSEDDRRRILDAASPGTRLLVETEKDSILHAAPDAEIIFAGHGRFDDDVLKAASRLQWLQTSSAGVEGFLTPAMTASSVTLTSAAGVFNAPIAEHLLAMMFAFARQLHRYRDRQRVTEWGHVDGMGELGGKTLGVVGLGEIGGELARRAACLGMRVIAVKRHVPASPPDGVEWVRDLGGLLDLAREADHMAITLPNTSATRGVVSAEVLAAMKPTACLYNIGRGVTVDQDALVEALREGRIAGAGLDVTTPEPLPPDHPLWRLDNVILTTHVAGSSSQTGARGVDFFIENLKRYLAGEPLRSVVDKEAGY